MSYVVLMHESQPLEEFQRVRVTTTNLYYLEQLAKAFYPFSNRVKIWISVIPK